MEQAVDDKIYCETAVQPGELVTFNVQGRRTSTKKITRDKQQVEISEIPTTYVSEAIQESEIESISPKGAKIKTKIVKRKRQGKDDEITIEQQLESGEIYTSTATQGSELVIFHPQTREKLVT